MTREEFKEMFMLDEAYMNEVVENELFKGYACNFYEYAEYKLKELVEKAGYIIRVKESLHQDIIDELYKMYKKYGCNLKDWLVEKQEMYPDCIEKK